MTGMRCLCTLIAVLLACENSCRQRAATITRKIVTIHSTLAACLPEIRNSILHRCNEPKALHPFASYSDDSKRIVLHFEHFVCDEDNCSPSGCLHQVWALVRGHYLLVRSYYAPAGD